MSLNKHYRKVPPQLSDEELLSHTTRVLRQCGVENQTQAQFTYEICLEILEGSNIALNNFSKKNFTNQSKRVSKSSLITNKTSNNYTLSPFYSLLPHPKIRKNSIPWKQAYSIAISFLKEFGMHTTLATFEIEFRYSPEKNIINANPQKSFFLTSNDNNDDYDSDNEYYRNIPVADTSFMENLKASEYLSYLQRINDSIYNITGNYSYLTSRGKQYQNKNSTRNTSYLDDSNTNLQNVIPATFKEKVKDFVLRQNLSLSSKPKGSNNSISTSEIIIDNGSFINDYTFKNENKLHYADSANRLKEMANTYQMKKEKNSNNEIEIDIEIEKEDNMTPSSINFSSNSRTLKKQNKSNLSKFKK